MAETKGVIPLCHPNNFSWDSNYNRLIPVTGEKRETLQLVPEAMDVIEGIREPIAVICICGPARSGKSYMLSQLLDGVEFELGHTMTSQTTGIWMSKEPKMLTTANGERVRLILLDTEGIGAGDSSDDQTNDRWDNQIFTLSTLISSYLIYNSQGVPNANDLEKLNFIAKLSESVHTQMRGGCEDASSLACFRNYSPDFLWLVRDLLLQPTDKNGQKCDIKTFLQDKLLKSEDDDDSDVQARRNAIRKNIRELFPTFDAYGLPMPSLEPEVIQNMSDPRYQTEISRKFTSEIRNIKQRILRQVKPKRMTGAAFLTGSTLVELLKMYVKLLNEDGCVPEWLSVWENAVKIVGEKALNAAVGEYKTWMESILHELPCATDYVLSVHNGAIKQACELFSEETRMTTDTMNEYISRLMKTCAEFDEVTRVCSGGILMDIMNKNAIASEEFCVELCLSLQKEYIDPILDNITAETNFEDLLNSVEKVNKEYESRAIGPCTGSVQHRYANAFQQRLTEAAKGISKMKHYDEKLKAEMQEKIQKQAEMELMAQQNKVLGENMKMAENQHREQVTMMQQQQEKAQTEMNRLQEAQKQDKDRLMGMINNMKESHTTTIKSLMQSQEQQIKDLNDKNAENTRLLLEQQKRLEEKINQRPPPPPPSPPKKGGCTIL